MSIIIQLIKVYYYPYITIIKYYLLYSLANIEGYIRVLVI